MLSDSCPWLVVVVEAEWRRSDAKKQEGLLWLRFGFFEVEWIECG
jgi:hypothetical protein